MIDKNLNKNQSPWIHSWRFDLFFFHFSGPILLALALILYCFLGSKIFLSLSILQVVVFSLPHFCLTWTYLNPQNRDSNIPYKAVIFSSLVAFILALTLVATDNEYTKQILANILLYLGLWHIMRQHQGMCRLYDSTQSARWKDATLGRLGNYSIWFIALCYFSQLFYHFSDHSAPSVWPRKISMPYLASLCFYFSCLLMIIFGYLIAKKMIWERRRRKLNIPWPQLCLVLYSFLLVFVLAIYLPVSLAPLLYLITVAAHNIQYFGFVWLFEKYRAPILLEGNASLALTQRLVLRGEWLKISMIFLTLSLIVYILGGISRPGWSNLVISLSPLSLFLSVSHYLIDGFIWQSKYNGRMKDFAYACANTTSRGYTPNDNSKSVP